METASPYLTVSERMRENHENAKKKNATAGIPKSKGAPLLFCWLQTTKLSASGVVMVVVERGLIPFSTTLGGEGMVQLIECSAYPCFHAVAAAAIFANGPFCNPIAPGRRSEKPPPSFRDMLYCTAPIVSFFSFLSNEEVFITKQKKN